jgi:hypothetical protein
MRPARIALILVFCLLASLSGAQSAAAPGLPFSVGSYEGIYYGSPALTGAMSGLGSAFSGFRGGLCADFRFRLAKTLGAGSEIGAEYMLIQDGSGAWAVNLLDMPVRLKLSASSGEALRSELFGGLLLSMVMAPALIDFIPYADLGGRLVMGPVYFEVSYEISFFPALIESFPRFGAGAYLPLLK